MTDLLLLATEAGHVAPEHIAAKLAVPLGIVIFCGSIYMLLWSNYGAKKGALIYLSSLFAFTMMLGVFWWFGAPGTPRNTGLQNLPGQASDHYFGQWLACEPGSDRCSLYESTQDFARFVTPEAHTGNEGKTSEELEADIKYSLLVGDLNQAQQRMLELHFPDVLGANRRTALKSALDEQYAAMLPELRANPDIDPDGVDEDGNSTIKQQDPFYTAVPADTRVTDDGVLVAGVTFETYANYTDSVSFATFQVGPLESRTYFAVRDPGALWFPSAVWTLASLLLFLFFLWRLDALEQREKAEQVEADQPEDVAVPVFQ